MPGTLAIDLGSTTTVVLLPRSMARVPVMGERDAPRKGAEGRLI
jgi:hypothetical protein